MLAHLPVVAIKHRALKLPAPLQLAAARLEREDCLVAGFLALHLDLSIQLRPVVPKDEIIDTDGGPVPAVLLATAVELERLAAVHDQLDRLAPELGLDLKLSLRFPRMRLPDAAGCVVRRHRRVVADLLAQVPHVALWRAPLVCLAKQRVEWLALTQRLRVVARQLPHSHKHHARDRVGRRRRRIHERHVLKRLSEALQEVERLVDGGRHRDACEVLSNHVLEDGPHAEAAAKRLWEWHARTAATRCRDLGRAPAAWPRQHAPALAVRLG
mmetsp:Transcript_14748/g.43283  ORF Transcript_14748/g.43283 Transcript_14748/m.43283 type:complete len:270 (+) Transcript_14748:23-832(+)